MILDILIGCHFLLSVVLGAQVRHPQELRIDIDDDLLNWTEKKSNNVDCSVYYMRLVSHLMKSKRFQADSRNPDYYIATVPLRLNKKQFELLVNQNVNGLNLNEIDDLIADVVKQSNDDDWDYPVAQILFDHYRQQLINSLPHINTPMVQIVIAGLIIILLNRMFHFSRIKFSALILLVLLAICVISYSISYYDCLSDLEVEQMIQLSKQKSNNNPCKDYHGEHESFWASMRSAFFNSENKCLEHMRKTFKQAKTICDPLEVFAKWFAKIQMSYFSSVFGGFFELLTKATSSSNFLTKTIFWVAGSALFIFLIVSFGKSVIKHSFKGIFKVLSTTTVTDPEPSTHRTPDYGLLSSKMDEILHENRQMKRELSMIRECSVERSLQQSTEAIGSGSKLTSIEEDSPKK